MKKKKIDEAVVTTALSEKEQKDIQKEFNKAVDEEVKTRLAVIVEGALATITKKIDEDFTAQSAKKIAQVDENVGKFIDHLVAEILPKQLIDVVTEGYRYAKYVKAVEDSVVDEAVQIASKKVAGDVDSLRAQLEEMKGKFADLFEKHVEVTRKDAIMEKLHVAEKHLDEYPDSVSNVIRKVLKETVNWTEIPKDKIEPKIKRIAEMLSKQVINERNVIDGEEESEEGEDIQEKQNGRGSGRVGKGVTIISEEQMEEAQKPIDAHVEALLERFIP